MKLASTRIPIPIPPYDTRNEYISLADYIYHVAKEFQFKNLKTILVSRLRMSNWAISAKHTNLFAVLMYLYSRHGAIPDPGQMKKPKTIKFVAMA